MKRCEVGSSPRWARRKEDRPQELLCAALQVFQEKGFAGTRLDEVAKMAGVSKGTVYLYYTNKEDLLKAVVREHISPIVTEIREEIALQPFANQTELLEFSVRQWWVRYGSTKLGAVSKIILGESHLFPDMTQFFYTEVIQPWWSYLQGILQRGVDTGEFVAMDTEYAARILSSPLVILSLWTRTMDINCQTDTNPDRFLNTYVHLMIQGLKNSAHDSTARTHSAGASTRTALGGIADAFGLFKIQT